MELNVEKSKAMIFNFTHNYQFSTNLSHNGDDVEVINQTKLLGTIITDDLKWHKNTESLVRRANARMRIMHKISEFSAPREDMIQIYFSYIRSILEQSSTVWHSSLTVEDSQDIERVQKSAVRITLKEEYNNYDDALDILDIETLSERRENMSLKFARNCLKNDLTSDLFPLNPTDGPEQGRRTNTGFCMLIQTD